MAVFRIERTRDYTVMSNHHLRNHELSLKAKGLLSMMLSLPDDWNYTTRGLAKICKEGVDAIGSALRELETTGYIVRHQLRDQQGRISDTEYVIYEQPQPRQPETPGPDTAVPDTENPYLDKPDTEKPAELNIEKSNTKKSITHGSSTDSIPFREPAAAQLPERKGRNSMSLTEMESYRDLILENIEYDHLCREFTTYREDLDEIVELMVETVCAKRKTTRIAGSDFKNPVDLMFDALEAEKPNHFAVRQYKKYKLAAGKTAKSILISCGARLAVFDIAELREVTSYDELELDTLGDQRTALFLIMSDTDDSFNFLISMCYTQLFNLLCEKADDVYGGRLPVHVRCLIDECANIGQIPRLEKLVATIRSREISACLVLQAQSQLKAIYKDNADTIIGNMDTSIFLGGKEPTTLKELAAMLGKETIDTVRPERALSKVV